MYSVGCGEGVACDNDRMQSQRSALSYTTLLALLIFAIPSLAAAQSNTALTAAQIQAQIKLLLAEVAELQAAIAGSGSTGTAANPAVLPPVASGVCPQIGRVLRRGQSGDDVSRLQSFLAADPSVYPEAQVTGFYGALTEAAVKRWQAKFNIVSSGDADSTGYGVVGPRTAAAIALQCGGGGSAPGQFIPRDQGTSGAVGPTVGGYIQVSPITGVAPLAVQVVANVNTVNSCEGATYTLDWGDGTIASSIPVAAGVCTQAQQTFSHIYVSPGTYTIRLSAGAHSTTAMVQVAAAQ